MRGYSSGLLAVSLFLIVFCGWAKAGADHDCLTLRDKAARIQACTQVIEGAGYDSRQRASAFRTRGRARLEAGAMREALADLDEAIRLSDEDAAALAARGQVYLSRNDPTRALADFDAALKLDGNNADVLILRATRILSAAMRRRRSPTSTPFWRCSRAARTRSTTAGSPIAVPGMWTGRLPISLRRSPRVRFMRSPSTTGAMRMSPRGARRKQLLISSVHLRSIPVLWARATG